MARTLDPYPDLTAEMLEVPPLPSGETIRVPGRGELFVRRLRGGDGVPVLLLHGWMASADINWFLLYEALGRRHPVIALDHRGHGRGPRPAVRFTMEDCADDAAALLQHLRVPGAVVVGYSMGGSIALHLWRRHPDLVRGLVLGGTALEFREGARGRILRGLMHLVSVLFRWPAGRYALARIIGHRRTIPFALRPYRAWIEGEFSRADPTDVGEAGRQLLRFDAKELTGTMDIPVVVVVTGRDTLVPAELQRRMAEALGARAFEIDADHAAPVIAAEAFADIILDAIAWIDARAAEEPSPGPPAGGPDRR